MGPNSVRLAEIVNKAKAGDRDIAAVVIPKKLAMCMADELYAVDIENGTGFSEMDDFDGEFIEKEIEEKIRYIGLVSTGGVVGTFLDLPLLVAKDTVACTMTTEELAAIGLDADITEES